MSQKRHLRTTEKDRRRGRDIWLFGGIDVDLLGPFVRKETAVARWRWWRQRWRWRQRWQQRRQRRRQRGEGGSFRRVGRRVNHDLHYRRRTLPRLLLCVTPLHVIPTVLIKIKGTEK